MNVKTEVKPQIFLTDYGSYNAGRQFEFGHWLDLEQFDSYGDLSDYIRKHFRACDQKSPLYGGIREEIMITDYEGYPERLYDESGNLEEVMRFVIGQKESTYDREIFAAYVDHFGLPESGRNIDDAISERYQGKFLTDADYAETDFEHLNLPNELPYICIDWMWVSQTLDFVSSGNHYFLS